MKTMKLAFFTCFITLLFSTLPLVANSRMVQRCSLNGLDLEKYLNDVENSIDPDSFCRVINRALETGFYCVCSLLASAGPLSRAPLSFQASKCFIAVPSLAQCAALVPELLPPPVTDPSLPILFPPEIPILPPPPPVTDPTLPILFPPQIPILPPPPPPVTDPVFPILYPPEIPSLPPPVTTPTTFLLPFPPPPPQLENTQFQLNSTARDSPKVVQGEPLMSNNTSSNLTEVKSKCEFSSGNKAINIKELMIFLVIALSWCMASVLNFVLFLGSF